MERKLRKSKKAEETQTVIEIKTRNEYKQRHNTQKMTDIKINSCEETNIFCISLDRLALKTF